MDGTRNSIKRWDPEREGKYGEVVYQGNERKKMKVKDLAIAER